MGPLLTITAKDLRQRLRDRSAYLYGIVVPLALAAVFALVLPGAAEEDLSLEVGVTDEGGGAIATAFRGALEGAEVVGEVTSVADEAAAREAVDAGRLDAAYVVPGDLGEAVSAGRPARLQVVVDPDRPLAQVVATSLAEGFVQRIRTGALAVAAVAAVSGGGLDDATAARTARLAAARGPAVVLEVGTTDDDRLDTTTYLAAGMAVFFLFFTVQFGVLSLLEERERGTLARLRAAPIRPWVVRGAKVLTSVVLGLVSMAVLVVATTVLLGARWGDPVGVAVLVVCGVLAASAIVALVGVVARTSEQASVWQTVIGVVLGLLGGAFFPLTDAPGWLLALQRTSPHHWFLEGLGQLAGGGGLLDAAPAAVALLAFGAAATVAAGLLAERGAA